MPNHCMRATHATAPTTPSASTDPANHPIRDHWRFLPAAPALAHLHNNTPLYKAAAMNKITCRGREMPRTAAFGSGPLSDWCHALCHCASGSLSLYREAAGASVGACKLQRGASGLGVANGRPMDVSHCAALLNANVQTVQLACQENRFINRCTARQLPDIRFGVWRVKFDVCDCRVSCCCNVSL